MSRPKGRLICVIATAMPRLPPEPSLDWSNPDTPRAASFDDIYFSSRGGLAESEAVFLAGTGLPEGWQNRDRFALCELGFGTGLNILAVWRAWKLARKPHAQLHISSIEAYPLAKADAARALAAFPEVADLAESLLSRWPVRAYGPQRLWFPEDGLSLTLHIGEAESVLAGMSGAFDAWFLDGFAPARNPGMWSAETLRHVGRLSAPGARLATFTVAGDVRRGLSSAGFAVEKKPGFGAKRERLEARYSDAPKNEPSGSLYPYRAAHPKRVAVVGAGIAGASVAHALNRRGVETIVLDAALALVAGASGNPAALVMPRLDRGGALREFYLAAYLAAVATYEDLGVFDACGVEQRAAADDAAMADLLGDPPLPEEWLQALPSGAALHARAGLVRPRTAIDAMLRGSRLMLEDPIAALEQAETGWLLRAPDHRALLKADAVVIASGAALTQFAPAAFLPIALSRGQVEWGPGAHLSRARVHSNYVAPFEDGVLFGATFDKMDTLEDVAADEDSRRRNLEALAVLAPEIAAKINSNALQSRVSVRATTPDRAPIAGLLPDAEKWLAQYAPLEHGRKIETDLPPPAHAGVYVIGGLGARGFTLAPLLGEMIAAEMFAEPSLLPQFARDAIHPARFLHRALKRR